MLSAARGAGALRKGKVSEPRCWVVKCVLCTSVHNVFCQHTPKQRTELTPDEKQELAEAFSMFDAEKTGRIDLHELKVPYSGCVVLCRCVLVCSASRGAAGLLNGCPRRPLWSDHQSINSIESTHQTKPKSTNP